MRITQIQNSYLYEGLSPSSSSTMMLWESAGFKLREAALTADQIQQIFQSVEKGSTDAGGNRTLLGKGKDAAQAVNKAWEDLKTKIQDSGPIKNVDSAYDSAVAKIEKGLGGPDNVLNQVIQRYRKFAKEHPIAQGFIYSALIAAAGISGAGLGGAAVLGLLKMTDKLLQGEKFSSAAYSGAKTGAMAYGASKIGDYLKGKPEGDAPSAGAATDSAAGAIRGSRGLADEAARIFKEKVAAGEITDYNSYQQGMQDALDQALKNAGGQMSFQSQQTAQMILKSKLDAVAAQAGGGQFSGSGPEKVAAVIKGLGGTVNQDSIDKASAAAATMRKAMGGESINHTGKKLSEGQVYMIFNRIVREELTEGPMDAIKGMAGKAADWAQTKGKNLTTKITADKLNSAWKKAGSPMDSEELSKFLAAQGIAKDVVDTVYAELKLSPGDESKKPGPGDKGYYGKGDPEQTKITVAKMSDQQLEKFLSKSVDPDNPHVQIAKAELENRKSGGASPTTLYAQIKADVSKLDSKGKKRIAAYLQKQLGTI
jgi:hypothetical protein